MRRTQAAVEPSSFELSEKVAEFIDGYRYGGSRKTLLHYEDHLGRCFMTFMKRKHVSTLDGVTPAVLREYLQAEAATGIAPSTLASRYQAGATFFKWAEDQEYVQFSPFRKVRRPKVPQAAVIGFDKNEARRLTDESARGGGWIGLRDQAIVVFLFDTGARANELLSLTAGDVDFARKRALLHGKGSKDRFVPLGPKNLAALRAYLKVRPQNAVANLWLTQRRTVMAEGALWMMLTNLGKYAKVDNVHAHRFRHTYASKWYTRHRDIMALRNLLGHAKVETTQRYLRSLGLDYGTGDEYATPTSW